VAFFLCFLLQVEVAVTVGEEEGRSRFGSPLLPVFFLRRHVNPRAASDGGAWRRRTAAVLVVQKAFPVIPDCFGAILYFFCFV